MAPSLHLERAQSLTDTGSLVISETSSIQIDNDEDVFLSDVIVTPGLIDLHTHVFAGQEGGVSPDIYAARAGVTTLVDTGSAGAGIFDAFLDGVISRSRTRIIPFLNISSIGTTSFRLAGELRTLAYSDIGAAIDCVHRHPGLIAGVKVRASSDVGGDNAPIALQRARQVADEVGLPLMVHLGPAPSSIDHSLAQLQSGDILTHAFSGWEGNSLITGTRVRQSAREARDRGVLFDVGHGMSGMSSEVARTAISEGFPPDTISTDIHAYSRDIVRDLPWVMSKFLAFGMSLEAVLAAASLTPWRALPGSFQPADHSRDRTILQLTRAEGEAVDHLGKSFPMGAQVIPLLSVRENEVTWAKTPEEIAQLQRGRSL